MTQVYMPVIRALVVGTLVAATAAVLHVTVQTARAAGAYGEAYDYRSVDEARRSALAKCKHEACAVVEGHARLRPRWGSRSRGSTLAQNAALRSCENEAAKAVRHLHFVSVAPGARAGTDSSLAPPSA